ncbi:MAG: hypothetical protein HFG27_05075 [Provencibacterium sp.]|jgi:hypothetical protein|nr:hypothetical protein [Provencibacterium sp.]
MADTYIEYLVKKRSTSKDILLKILIVLAAAVIAILLFLLSPILGMFSMFGYLIAFGAIYGAYRLISMMNLEYEYLLTNGDMDIDKIMNRNSRKRLLSVKCSSFEALGPYRAAEHQNKQYQTRIMACSSPSDPDVWYASFKHSKHGHTLLVFNTSERLLEAIRPFISKQLAFQVFVKKAAQ